MDDFKPQPDSSVIRGKLVLTSSASLTIAAPAAHARLLGRLGAVVRVARDSRGVSLVSLSSATGIPKTTLSDAETGRVDLRISQVVSIARALDLSPSWLMQRVQ